MTKITDIIATKSALGTTNKEIADTLQSDDNSDHSFVKEGQEPLCGFFFGKKPTDLTSQEQHTVFKVKDQHDNAFLIHPYSGNVYKHNATSKKWEQSSDFHPYTYLDSHFPSNWHGSGTNDWNFEKAKNARGEELDQKPTIEAYFHPSFVAKETPPTKPLEAEVPTKPLEAEVPAKPAPETAKPTPETAKPAKAHAKPAKIDVKESTDNTMEFKEFKELDKTLPAGNLKDNLGKINDELTKLKLPEGSEPFKYAQTDNGGLAIKVPKEANMVDVIKGLKAAGIEDKDIHLSERAAKQLKEEMGQAGDAMSQREKLALNKLITASQKEEVSK